MQKATKEAYVHLSFSKVEATGNYTEKDWQNMKQRDPSDHALASSAA